MPKPDASHIRRWKDGCGGCQGFGCLDRAGHPPHPWDVDREVDPELTGARVDATRMMRGPEGMGLTLQMKPVWADVSSQAQ